MNKYDDVMRRLGVRNVRGEPRANLTEDAKQEFEQAIGYRLPDDYREFLSTYGITAGDGETRYGTLENPEEEEEASIEVFYGVRLGDGYDLLTIKEGFEDILPRHLLPIASAPGGQIVLSLAGDDKGMIYWWNPHRGSADPYDDLIPIAYNFDRFVNSLRIHAD